jgi:ribosomal protein S18 acetylase RimI-like enzyme
MFEIVNIDSGRGQLARRILDALPEWFGIPESVEAYVSACDGLPMLGARKIDRSIIGFIAVKLHSAVAAEAYVLGVMPDCHRRGCGRALFAAAEAQLKAEGIRYLTVKTLAASHLDPYYAATRKFYEAIGFEPIEVFPTLWSEDNPCLLMLKRLT